VGGNKPLPCVGAACPHLPEANQIAPAVQNKDCPQAPVASASSSYAAIHFCMQIAETTFMIQVSFFSKTRTHIKSI